MTAVNLSEVMDSYEAEISDLRRQIEEAKKDRNAFQDQCIRLRNERAVEKGAMLEQARVIEHLTRDITTIAAGDFKIPVREFAMHALAAIAGIGKEQP